MKDGVASRLADSLETALKLGGGRVIIDVMGQEEFFSVNIIHARFVVLQSIPLSQESFLSTIHLGLVPNVMDLEQRRSRC